MIVTGKKPTIYDIYLLFTSGVPIFAGCLGSEYCKAHVNQHELHAGFFSAMHSFSKESFQGTELNSILFDKLQVNFKIDTAHELMLVFVHPSNQDTNEIKKQMDAALDLFIKEYGNAVTPNGVVHDDMLEEYRMALRQRQIITFDEMVNVKPFLATPEQIGTKKYKFLRWFGLRD